MKILLSIIALLALSGCAHQDAWTTRDTVGQIIATIAIAGDGVSTSRIRRTPGIQEVGGARHFIGRQPTTRDTTTYFATVAISSYFISRALPAKWRPYFQGSEVIIFGGSWYNNCQIELC